MGREVLSHKAFTAVDTKVRSGGHSATHKAEQQAAAGLGVNSLVDPKSNNGLRISNSWKEPRARGRFELLRGLAMPVEFRLDTTASMGNNVDIAMRVLLKMYELLATGSNPVLGRYDTQICTSIFNDQGDRHPLLRSEFELDERIALQMSYMVPDRGGGDFPEDPQYGLFAAAYLTKAEIDQKYGLLGYDFTITDASGRLTIREDMLVEIFGEGVFAKAKENGHEIKRGDIPDTQTVAEALLKRAHAFVLQVNEEGETSRFWKGVFGAERVVKISSSELLPQVTAAIVGLTEGVLDLGSVVPFLKKEAQLPDREAQAILKAVSRIPLGAQAKLPNFDKIPLRGSLFESKTAVWPISPDEIRPEPKKKPWK